MSARPDRLAHVAILALLLLAAPHGALAGAAGYHDLGGNTAAKTTLPAAPRPQRMAANDDATAGEPRVLRVGPKRAYKRPSEALAVARDGDTIEIDAGEYLNDAACINGLRRLTIRGVGGYAHIRMSPGTGDQGPPQCDSRNRGLTRKGGRGTWGFNGVADVLLERLEFSGAASSSGNSAGVRIVKAKGDFVLRDVRLHHNQNGLISSGNSDLSLLMERVVLDQNGRIDGGGREHNVYVGNIKKFTLRESYSRRSLGGQLVKSRALENHILYNRLTDERPVDSNYQLEFHGLGKAYVIGNVLRKRDGSTNCCTLLHINVNPKRAHELYVVNNTFIYEAEPGRENRRFIRVLNPKETPVKVVLKNNLFVSDDASVRLVYTPYPGVDVDLEANLQLPLSTDVFVDLADTDLRLRSHAHAINGGVDPGSANGVALMPTRQYAHGARSEARAVSGPLIDIGAYEFTGTPDREYPPPLLRMTAENSMSDASSTIDWSSTADGCVASGGWSGKKPKSGRETTGQIVSPTPFTLTCKGPGGDVSETVMVRPPPPVDLQVGAVFDPVPAGSGSTVYWSARYAKSCQGLRGIEGPRPVRGSASTGPLQQATVYALSCTGLNGDQVDRSVTVRVAGSPPELPGPMHTVFHLRGEPAELSDGLVDGSAATPAKGPAGVFRQRGRGTAGFAPTADGKGIWLSFGGAGAQQNSDVAYYEFILPPKQVRELFDESGGEIRAKVVPRFDYASRERDFPRGNGSHQIGYILSVYDGKKSEAAYLAYEKWNGGKLHFYLRVPGGPKRTFIMEPEFGAAVLAKDSELDIRLAWDGRSDYLMLNGALAAKWDYTAKPVAWGPKVEMDIGAHRHKRYGGGWKILHDTLADLQIGRLAAE